MPERTLFYGLPPYGVGTPFVEGIRSYIWRLAEAHSLKPRMLLELLVKASSRFDEFELRRDVFSSRSHGLSSKMNEIRERLQVATGQYLGGTTLYRFRNAFAEQHLTQIKGPGRYCPICIMGPRDAHYDQLLWEVACVDACPIHRVVLRNSKICGADPDSMLQWQNRPYLNGVCKMCGSIGYQCVRQPPESACDGQVWIAENVGRLLATSLTENQAVSSERLKAGLQNILAKRYSGSVVAASEAAGISRGIVCSWLREGGKVSLSYLVQICMHAEADLSECVIGGFKESPSTGHPLRIIGRVNQRNSEDWIENAGRKIHSAFDDDPVPSVKQIAQQVGVDPKQLRNVFPSETKRLSKLFLEGRRNAFSKVKEKFQEIYYRSALELQSEGRAVNRRALERRTGFWSYDGRSTRGQALRAVLKTFDTAI